MGNTKNKQEIIYKIHRKQRKNLYNNLIEKSSKKYTEKEKGL